MNVVLYYSNTGECKRIAEKLAEKTGYVLTNITVNSKYDYENAVIVFPVYCQNIPKAINTLLTKLECKYLTIIAAYGKINYGNVLYEIQHRFSHTIVAAAYLPVKHAYLEEESFKDFSRLDAIAEKLNTTPTEVKIPRSRKNPFANFAPEWRSRVGVKIVRDNKCNSCATCNGICLLNAINCGKTNNKCIRCTKCAVNCPQGALTLKLSKPMRAYLNKRKRNELIIYT